MKKINVLFIGGGGREHATAWKAMQSPQAGTIYVAPGNPGTAMLGCQNIPIMPIPANFKMLGDLAVHLDIGLVVIGPENALADGIVTVFKRLGIPVFGPQDAWLIEASKSYAKNLMRAVGIPTADFEVFTDPRSAIDHVHSRNGDVVVKADGLAQGKGVRVCINDVKKAEDSIDDFMVKKTVGEAGAKVVIEERLEGVELSVHALSDGTHIKLFPFVRDHKHLLDGNKGPMTGGMGVCGPIDIDPDLMETIEKKIVLPCIQELRERGMPSIGCLYPGLMLTKDGPKVLEFNARFGDPEAQVYMRLLEDDVDLIEILLACCEGRLDRVDLRWKKEKCVCVTLAAHGYPDDPRKGDIVDLTRFDDQTIDNPEIIFHCGTEWKNGHLQTKGGRVLSYTGLIRDASEESVESVHIMIRNIGFDNLQYRSDIGKVW